MSSLGALDRSMSPTRIEWSEDHIEFLRTRYRTHGSVWCAQQLGRKKNSVIGKAHHLGLTDRRATADNKASRNRRKRPHRELAIKLWEMRQAGGTAFPS